MACGLHSIFVPKRYLDRRGSVGYIVSMMMSLLTTWTCTDCNTPTQIWFELEDTDMGVVTDKLIESRVKSIEVLEVEIAELVKLADTASKAGKTAGAMVFRSQAQLKSQRMNRLKSELAGLREVASQLTAEVVAKMPNVRKGE